MLAFPENLKRRRELEQPLAAYLTGLVAGCLSHQFTVEELEHLWDLAARFDVMRSLPPPLK